MKKSFMLIAVLSIGCFLIQSPVFSETLTQKPTAEQKDIYQKIEEITGLKGTFNNDKSVFKVTSPRTDVKVTVDGRPMSPFMGLTSWAGFQKDPKEGMMVMGDFVLFQDEVNPVMTAALDNGLDVTALHNHFFFDEPRVYFMHISGQGDPEKSARAVRMALDKVKAIRQGSPEPSNGFGTSSLPKENTITPKIIEDILGVKGQSKDGMVKAVIGRKTKMPCNCEVGKDMGVNTWAVFAGSDDHASVDGDFVVLESELQQTLKSLRHSGVNIVAIHHHMSGESPRMLFLHYWGIGSSADLARGLKKALDVQTK